MKKIFVLQMIFFWLPLFLSAQSPADTLSRYPGGRYLLKYPGRFELRDSKGLIDWWETMINTIELNYVTFQLVKRKEGDKWKTGLFRRSEGKLFLRPEYEQITGFFGSPRLVMVKGNSGFFVYSIKNGNKTREGFQSFRQFGKDCLAFNESGMFIYSEGLELKDSIAGSCQPINRVNNGEREYLLLNCQKGNVLLDDKYRFSPHPDWKGLIKMEGNLLLVEGQSGYGVYHLGHNRLLTSFDHQPNLYELHEARFMLFKGGSYILYDSTGKTLAKVQAGGMSSVDDFRAFFYLQNNLWGIMSSEGEVLKAPVFEHFDRSKVPVGEFIARTKGEKELKRYAWVYNERNGQKTITGIKLLGIYKENEPASNWPPNQPVDIKQNR